MLIKAAEPLTTSDTKTVSEWTRQMATLPQASKLATRILLLTLLFEVTENALMKVVALKCSHSKYVFVIVIYTSQTIFFWFLFLKELKLLGARVVENSGILDLLIKLLEVVQPCLQAAKEQKDIQTPKWVLLSPVFILIFTCKCYTSSSP